MRYLRLIFLLPFYTVAMLFAFVAGMIGGRDWRVTIQLAEHQEGQKMSEADIKIVFKE
jgi:hypothetical protein